MTHDMDSGTIDDYEQLLSELRSEMPDITTALERAHASRIKCLSKLSQDNRLTGLQALIHSLHTLHNEIDQLASLKKIAFLVLRVIANYEMAIEAYLSGLNAVVFDAMRDVLEIQYLITDFTHDHSRIDLWLSADQETLRKQFSANTLRTREANRLGIMPSNLATSTDYKGHSQFLHVNQRPHPFGNRGILSSRTFPEWSSPFWDMYRHGRSILRDLTQLIQSTGEYESVEEMLSNDQYGPMKHFFDIAVRVEHQETEFFIHFLGPNYKRGPDPTSA